MAALSSTAILTLALTCGHGADWRLIDAIAQHESGRNPAAISPPNRNGTYDAGLMQINSSNFGRFGLTRETALNDCKSVDAAVRHLIASGGPAAVKPAAVTQLIHALRQYNPRDP